MFDLGFSGLERGGGKREIRATKASLARLMDVKQVARGDTKLQPPVSLISSGGTHMSVSMTHRHPLNSRKQAAAAMTRTPTDMCVIHCVFFSVERETDDEESRSEIVKGGSDFCPSLPLAAFPEFRQTAAGRDIVAECVA